MTLEEYIKSNGLSEVEAMNALQDHGGLISDCCVNARDVATVDTPRAIEFLEKEGR
ncbi:MAG TPA: hypothetical protein VFA85_12805 [Terriglobales bacterium]|nr:hypothetical protein [Terriglobales bacterium]